MKTLAFLNKKMYKKIPFLYSKIYELHRFLKKKIFKTEDIFSWLTLTIFVSLSFFSLIPKFLDTKSEPQIITWKDFKPVYVYVCFVLLYWITGKVIQLWIKNTGILKKFILPGTYLIKNDIDKSIHLNLEGVDCSNYEFATKETADISAELNIKAYSRGPWGTNYQDKLERNLSHIVQNKHSIMFLRYAKTKDIVGFTHILPVSQDVWVKYTKGLIKDNEFAADYIISDSFNPKYINERPYGVILFGVVCTEVDNDNYSSINENKYYRYLGEVLEKAIAYHLNTLLKGYFSSKAKNPYSKVNVLLQNEDEYTFKGFFKGWANMKDISGDGCTIIQFVVKNNNS